MLGLLQDEFPDVTISKIRFLESQGLIDPERTPSGYRKFYDADVERLRFILREQREHFLPLKVIKDRLDSGEPGVDDNGNGGTAHDDDTAEPAPVEPAERAAPTEERVPIWMVRTPAPAATGPLGHAPDSFEEVASASGLTLEELREVERFGLVMGRAVGGDTLYDEDAVVAARTAGGSCATASSRATSACTATPPSGRRG